jgi:hypothetical protein
MLKDNFKETLAKGMKELRTQDWITPKEEVMLRANT